MNTIKVILLQGVRGKTEWEHENLKSALCRAFKLADLHNASVSTGNPREIVVNASGFYRKARNIRRNK